MEMFQRCYNLLSCYVLAHSPIALWLRARKHEADSEKNLSTLGLLNTKKPPQKLNLSASWNMSDIPADVLHEILLRIPAKFLILSVRAVCKDWRHVIDDPTFIKTHTNNQNSNTNSTLLIENYLDDGQLFSLSLDSLNNIDTIAAGQTIEANPLGSLRHHSFPQISHLVDSTCNGLILIEYHEKEEEKYSWVILNPLTRSFHELPRLDTNYFLPSAHVGFGYNYYTDDYKVVYINDYKENAYRTFVYSLKLNSWKMIKDIFPGDGFLIQRLGVFLNGSLHWKSSDNMIIAFDLATEEYSQLQLPMPDHMIVTSWFDWDFNAVDGCVVLSYNNENVMEVWVMQDYKVGKCSWMKIIILRRNEFDTYRPIAYLKSKGLIVLMKHSDELYLVDIEKKSSKMVSIQGFSTYFDCQIYQPGSLFRLDQSYDHVINGGSATKKLLKFSIKDAGICCMGNGIQVD